MRIALLLLAPTLLLAGCGSEGLVGDLPADAAHGAHDSGALGSDVALHLNQDAGATDAQLEASAADTSSPPDGSIASDAALPGHVQYSADRTLSAITPDIAENLRVIAQHASALKPDVFAKVGDSNTVSLNFLHCFAGTSVDLAGRDELASTLELFKGGDAAGTPPFTRVSRAATVGWSAGAVLSDDPSPLTQEVAAIAPSLAVVLFGTNDIQARDVFRFESSMLDITDQLIAQGIIPLLSSVPPRDDGADADSWVPRYSAIVRAIAQARQSPFLDLERELRELPDHGIGADGLHLSTYSPSGSARGCVFTTGALRYGFNRRNLITLQTLHRVRAALSGQPAPDSVAPRLQGRGTSNEPYVMGALPFGDLRDTSHQGTTLIDRYAGCSASQDESGAEILYRLDLSSSKTVRAMVFARNGVDVDLHLLAGQPSPASCVERNDKLIVRTLAAGTWFFSVDTYASAGAAKAGEYLFVAVAD
ncbi:MAG: SGNH/GDSL hydrolase family protein [Deltaproteobacteria bacterium]|nr:SGNH/GDSL hydrolase family protein [Deltaproteobacteria bacterium]